MILYDIGIWIFGGILRIAAWFDPKAKLWVTGRLEIFEQLRKTFQRETLKTESGVSSKEEALVGLMANDNIAWIHCASLGEFEQGRPVIEMLREKHPEYKILLTFFSPSGYEIRKNYEGADYVFYLPLDTPRNARRFISIVKPNIVIFIKYEFWLNYLRELQKIGCRTFVVSSLFRPNSIFFKFYGGPFRNGLRRFEAIFVQNEQSKELLSTIDVTNVVVAGDTRFDRVAAIAQGARELPIVSQFIDGSKVFVAGSTWAPDEELIVRLIHAYPDIKFIIAPHEINQEDIASLIDTIQLPTVRYTKSSNDTNLSQARVLIIDTIGVLSSVYQYADYGYIGGGFGTSIHNTLEAATFGLPIAFGPNYHKFKEAHDLISNGVACSVSNFEQLNAWLSSITINQSLYTTAHQNALSYISDNTGATAKFIEYIFSSASE